MTSKAQKMLEAGPYLERSMTIPYDIEKMDVERVVRIAHTTLKFFRKK